MSKQCPSSKPIFYAYIYLNPLKPGKFTYGDFLSFEYEPFYVGKGSGNRMYKHLYETLANTENTHKFYTIQKIKQNGFEPIIVKLNFNLKECKAHTFEKFYIKLIGRRDKGLGPLSNHTDGGEGSSGHIVTKEERKARSERMTGNNSPTKRPEVRKKLCDSKKGEKHPMYGKKRPEHSERMCGENNPNFGKRGSESSNSKKVMVNGNVYGCFKDAIIAEQISVYFINKYIKEEKDGFKYIF